MHSVLLSVSVLSLLPALIHCIAREDALTVKKWVSEAHSRRLAGAGNGPAPSQRSPGSLAAVGIIVFVECLMINKFA